LYLANGYNFWPSGKRSIITIGMRAKVTNSIPSGHIVKGEIVVGCTNCGGSPVGQVTIK